MSGSAPPMLRPAHEKQRKDSVIPTVLARSGKPLRFSGMRGIWNEPRRSATGSMFYGTRKVDSSDRFVIRVSRFVELGERSESAGWGKSREVSPVGGKCNPRHLTCEV